MRSAAFPLNLAPEVRAALEAHQPVVALESTVIAHGLPWPENLELARRMEARVRAGGATPATVALLKGEVKVGLIDSEIEYLARPVSPGAPGILKVSRRDYPVAVAQKRDGATTVAGTMIAAHWAGIKVFATGGIGGVHRGAGTDVSADLPELAHTPVVVVCAGAKAILDLPATLEWLETHGVPVVGYGTDEFPAFYSRESGLTLDARADSPAEAVKGRDILVTMTNASQPVLDGKLIEPGTHINAAGANTLVNRELDEIAVTRAGLIATDDIEGAKIECGDLAWPAERGLLAWEKVYDLAPIVAGLMPGRRSGEEITLFESQGIALEDVAASALIYERARERGIGAALPF